MGERVGSAVTKADETLAKIREAEKRISESRYGGASATAQGVAAMESVKAHGQ
jgi:hypothetical protein